MLTRQPYSQEEAYAAGYAFVVRMPFDLAALLTHIATALQTSLPEVDQPPQP